MSMARDLAAGEALARLPLPGDVAEPGRHEIGLHATRPSTPELRLVGPDDAAVSTARAMWSTAPAGPSPSAILTSRGVDAERFARLGCSP
jgi:hypothetical protein